MGIGTSSPAKPLHVTAAGRNASVRFTAQTGRDTALQLYKPDNTGWVVKHVTGANRLDINWDNVDNTAQFTAMSFLNNGNIGIGTRSPAAKLDVRGSLRMGGDNSRALYFSSGSNRNYFAPRLADNSNWDWGNEFGFSRSNGAWYFDGISGIGTTSPAAKLDVRAPSARVRVQDQGLLVNDAETTSGEVRVGFGLESTRVYSSTSLNLLGTSSLSLSGRGNNTDLHINSSGNIGVGRTNPTAKFDVNGEVKISTGSPTLRFDDSNGDGFMIHNNSDILYFMRDDNRNDSWDDGDDDRIVMRGSGSAVRMGIRTTNPAGASRCW